MIDQFRFTSLTSEDIIKNSVMQIKTIDDLTSPKLGALNKRCETCYQFFNRCCGHFGYIQLKEWYVKPILQQQLLTQLKSFCILHKRFEQKPCETITPVYYDKKVNNKVIWYFTAPLYCVSNESYYKKKDLKKPVMINPWYLGVLLGKGLFLNVVPVSGNTMRASNNINNNNIYNFIYERIIQYQNTQIKWINHVYSLELPSKEYSVMMIAIRLSMYKDTAKNPKAQIKNQMLKFISSKQNIAEPCSLFSAAITKYGLFRQSVNSIRVFKSSRTVIGGDGLIDSDQVVIPQEIAEQISVPVRVNDINLKQCKKLVMSQEYPKALKIIKYRNGMKIYMREFNQEFHADSLQKGDIIFRQIIDNDICLVNRYPSIREESFGSHRVIVKPIKTIQFNLQVVKKMTADFDGDEMQLYFMCSPDNVLELTLLSSMQRQFITYETGSNLIGGPPDLASGVFYAKQLDKSQAIEKIIKRYIPNLSYTSKDIIIKNGKVIKFDKSLADAGSAFMTWLQFTFGGTIALKIMDDIIRYIYTVNEFVGSTLYSSLFNKCPEQLKQLTYQALDRADQIVKHYYSQPVYDSQSCNLEIANVLQKDQLQQKQELIKILKVDRPVFYNTLVDKFDEQLRAGVICVGQIYNEKGERLYNPTRLLPCFNKFTMKTSEQGFVLGSYIGGLSQTELFLDSIASRKQLYVKSNSVEKDGYTARRILKGANNVIAGYNGLVFSDSETVVSLQYGQCNYNPRCYQKVTLELDEIIDTPRNKSILKTLESLSKQYSTFNPYYKHQDGCVTFALPFKPNQTEITEAELSALLSCRMCQNMSDSLKDIIYIQCWQFWAYCCLTMKIVKKKPTYDIVKQYIKAQVSPGELVGLKAAYASSQPYTQETLHAIHKKVVAILTKEVERFTGSAKFMEIATNTKGPIVVEFKLVEGYSPKEFIQKYESFYLKDLKPSFRIYYTNKKYTLSIRLDINVLGLFNTYFQNLIDFLGKQFVVQDIISSDDHFVDIIVTGGMFELISFCSNDQFISCSNLINLKIKNGTKDTIEGNVFVSKNNKKNSYISELFNIREINPDTIYCSNPYEYEHLFGIERCNQIIHLELFHNLSTIEATKEVQGVHVKLLTDILTQTGEYKNFSSNCYKSQIQKSPLEMILFEQSPMFLSVALKHQYKYRANTLLTQNILGNNAHAGSTFCDIYSDDYLYQQNVKDVHTQIVKTLK